MTRRAARLFRALPPSRGRFAATLSDLVDAFARVNDRVDWSNPYLQDPFGG